MTNIAVLGSCVSRDNFNSMFIPNYKDYYQCSIHQNQMSMISLASKPIPFEENLIDNLKPFDARHFKTELDKSFLNDMIKEQPDYLILDFYGDLFYGVQKIGDSFITNKKWLFSKTSQYERLDKREEYSIHRDPDVYFPMWKKGVAFLFDFLKKNVPNCKVIVNKARFVDEYIDKNTGEIKIISKSGRHRKINVVNYNKWWDTLDRYVIKKYKVRAIDYGDKVYRAIEDHPWGMFYVHYEMEFYQEFTRQLLAIIEEDQKQEGNHEAVSVQDFKPNNSITITCNFKNKISKNTYTNPHYSAYRKALSRFGNPFSDFTSESWTSTYDKIAVLDHITVSSVTEKKKAISQRIFSFNLVKAIEDEFIEIDSNHPVKWLRSHISEMTCRWWGKGSSSKGKIAHLTCWNDAFGKWGNPVTVQTTEDMFTNISISYNREDKGNVLDYIDSQGRVHVLVFSDPSDGKTPSVVETDYIEITFTLEKESLSIEKPSLINRIKLRLRRKISV